MFAIASLRASPMVKALGSLKVAPEAASVVLAGVGVAGAPEGAELAWAGAAGGAGVDTAAGAGVEGAAEEEAAAGAGLGSLGYIGPIHQWFAL